MSVPDLTPHDLPPSADVVIVGAGPAGAATARLLARLGHDVVLLDRHRFPREKACGDCLSAEATRLLSRIGLLDRVLDARPALLRGWRIVAPAGHDFVGTFSDTGPHSGTPLGAFPNVRSAAPSGMGSSSSSSSSNAPSNALSIRRALFDAALVDGAKEAGARFVAPAQVTDLLRDGRGRVTGVRIRADDGDPLTLRARLTIGADGLRSIVARRLDLVGRAPVLRKLSLSVHLPEVAGLADIGEMHLTDGACAGLAPITGIDEASAGRRANLTLVVDSTRFARDVARDRDAFFARMIERFPRLAGRVPIADVLKAEVLASGPFDRPTRDVVVDGAALVGDAAGYYDPFTGQGIYQALAGAELLAAEADAALRSGDVSARRLRRYARRRAALVDEARALQRVIEFVLSRPALADLAVRRLARSPLAAEAIIAATGDLRPARSLLSPHIALDLLLGTLRSEAPS